MMPMESNRTSEPPLSIAKRLANVQARIRAACVRSNRDPRSVTLVVVAKKQPEDRIAEAIAAGHLEFGDNYVQELAAHRARFDDPRIVWHFIGPIQSNKLKRAFELASVLHTIDSQKLAEGLVKLAPRPDGPVRVLVEVNLAGEATKAGCPPDEAKKIVTTLLSARAVTPTGLMCIPPPHEPARPYFRKLSSLRDELARDLSVPLLDLSMGMSEDFEVAVEEGATFVRIGTAILGERSTAIPSDAATPTKEG